MRIFSGPAKVFDDEDSAIEAMRNRAVNHGDVIVLRYIGPKGVPGMLHAEASSMALVGLGLHRGVGLVTDGRFSGFNHGPIVGHITPEAFEGGALALVRDGDRITVDIQKRLIEVDLSNGELASRRCEWKQPVAKVKRGWLALYAANCRPASEGAAMQSW